MDNFMAGRTPTSWNRDDRDLLVKVSTLLETVIADVRTIKTGAETGIARLEASKIDRTEAVQIQNENLRIQQDQEARMRFIEKYVFLALGAIAIGSFALNYFHPFAP